VTASRVAAWLGVREGEHRLALLLAVFAFSTSGGGSLGGNAVDALFFARYGVAALPKMYVALAGVTLATTLALGLLIGRGARERLYVGVCAVLAGWLALERAALALAGGWVYPVLWLSMNLMGLVQGLAVWGLAGALCDTRQAKRLFPLVAGSGVLGAVVGGAATPPLARLLHSENLLLVWAGALLVALAAGQGLLRERTSPRPVARPATGLRPLLSGYVAVRRSALLGWLALTAGAASLLAYLLTFPFAAAAARAFPSADALAGFLGAFQALSTGAAFLLSLAAGRLYAAIGLPRAVLLLPLIYSAGFAALLVAPVFPVLVAARFVQAAYLFGVQSSAFHALFNVVPGDRRDQARAFVDGVATQVGTAAAGMLLLSGDVTALERPLFALGLAAALGATACAWGVMRSYAGAIAAALREGRPLIFVRASAPGLGAAGDAQAVDLLRRSLRSEDPFLRRGAAELAPRFGSILGRELAGLTADADPGVRAAAVRALAAAPTSTAAEALRSATGDPEAAVRAAAAAGLGRLGDTEAARRALAGLAESPSPAARVEAQHGLEAWGAQGPRDLVVRGLSDPAPSVRRAAVRAAVSASLEPAALVPMLGECDPGVREAAATGCAALVDRTRLCQLLEDPALADGALRALELAARPPSSEDLEPRLTAQAEEAARWHRLARMASGRGEACAPLLSAAFLDRARHAALRAIRLAALVDRRETLATAAGSLIGHEPEQRANAVEVVETCPDPRVRHLGRLFEDSLEPLAPADGWLDEIGSDPSPVVAAAVAVLRGGTGGGGDARGEATVATVNALERVLLLRRVPLFADLGPEDLGSLAAVMDELVFEDGETLVREGEAGSVMFIIVAGSVRVVGHGRDLAERHPGDVVGEMAPLTGEPRTATLVAAGHVRALTLSAAQLESAVGERPELGMALIRLLARRLVEQR
jgi:HEAT repeat protein